MCEGDRGLEHLGNVLLLLIHTFSVLSLQLKKTTVTQQVRHRHVVVVVFFTLINRPQPYPVIYVVANPVRGHKEVPRSTGHIMVTTRYSDQQGSKSRQKIMQLYKRWHRPVTTWFNKPPLFHIESSLDRLGLLSPTHDQRSQQQIGRICSNQF